MVYDLELIAAEAAAPVDAGLGRALFDAVLLGDLGARVAARAARQAVERAAPRKAASQASPLHGGTKDARKAKARLTAAGHAAVLDDVAAADRRLPFCFRHGQRTRRVARSVGRTSFISGPLPQR